MQLLWSLGEPFRSKAAGNLCPSTRWWTSAAGPCKLCAGLLPESRLADDLIVPTRFGLAVTCACVAAVVLPGVATSDTLLDTSTVLDTTSVPTVSSPLPVPTTSTPVDPLGGVTGTDPVSTVTQPSQSPSPSPSPDGSSGSTSGHSAITGGGSSTTTGGSTRRSGSTTGGGGSG